MLIRAWPLLVIIPAVFGMAAWIVADRAPESARAVGLVRIANIDGYGFVESPDEVVARISSPSFLGAVLGAKGINTGPRAALFADALPKTSLIRLVADAPDVQSANALFRAAAERLAADHAPTVEHLKAATELRLEEIDRLVAQADAEMAKSVINPSDIPYYVTRMRLLEEASKLRREAMELRLKTNPKAFPTTSLLDAPHITVIKNPPQRPAMMAAAAGLAAAILAAYALRLARGPSPLTTAHAAPAPAAAPTSD